MNEKQNPKKIKHHRITIYQCIVKENIGVLVFIELVFQLGIGPYLKIQKAQRLEGHQSKELQKRNIKLIEQ